MLDRASTFANPEIIRLLKNDFIPVAIDQAYQRRQKDAEGEFYRRIASQSPRNNFQQTTQGLYIAAPDGTLLGFTNNRSPERVLRIFRAASARAIERATVITPGKPDARYNPAPPEGGLVVRVNARILDGYEKTDNQWRKIMQNATSRDNLWISKAEHRALADGRITKALQRRIARYHLVDNTRGEPPMWRENEVRRVEMTLNNGRLTGKVHLRTDSGDREYEADLFGELQIENGSVKRFDVVAKGLFRGEGRYTTNAPKGRFPFAVAFSLADMTDVADRIPPQGSRGWVPGYMK